MEVIGEAFNLFNQIIVSGVNSTYSAYNASGKGGCTAPSSVPTGSSFVGCIAPYAPSAAYQAFGKMSSTNNQLLWAASDSGLAQAVLLTENKAEKRGRRLRLPPALFMHTKLAV